MRENKDDQVDLIDFEEEENRKDTQELRCQPYYCSHLQLRPGIMYSYAAGCGAASGVPIYRHDFSAKLSLFPITLDQVHVD